MRTVRCIGRLGKRGGVFLGDVSGQRGICLVGYVCLGGMSGQEGCLPRGVSAWGVYA